MAIKVLYYSKTDISGPASRYRIFQYRDILEKKGIELTIAPAFSNRYLGAERESGWKKYFVKAFEASLGFIKRCWSFHKVFDAQVVAIEREYYPCFPPLFELLIRIIKGGYILELDDAIFLSRGRRRKFPATVRMADCVIAGNAYVEAYSRRFNENVVTVPTCVDTDRYRSKENYEFKDNPTVGWVGLPFNFKHLESISNPLIRLCQEQHVDIAICSGRPPAMSFPFRFIHWSLEEEVETIRAFDVGIMPLVDTPFSRGKSGLKILQYMAAGVPVVASPVGVNSEIVEDGVNGYLAESHEDWYGKIISLVNDQELRKTMGEAGRKTVEKHYSLKRWGASLAEVYLGAVK